MATLYTCKDPLLPGVLPIHISVSKARAEAAAQFKWHNVIERNWRLIQMSSTRPIISMAKKKIRDCLTHDEGSRSFPTSHWSVCVCELYLFIGCGGSVEVRWNCASVIVRKLRPISHWFALDLTSIVYSMYAGSVFYYYFSQIEA